MTVPELLGALAILCFLVGFGIYIASDVINDCRGEIEEWRREWTVTHTRPYDREEDAA